MTSPVEGTAPEPDARASTSRDPAPLDLPAWCHLTGHAYLGPVPAARPTYAMRTVPAPAGTDPAFPWHRRA